MRPGGSHPGRRGGRGASLRAARVGTALGACTGRSIFEWKEERRLVKSPSPTEIGEISDGDWRNFQRRLKQSFSDGDWRNLRRRWRNLRRRLVKSPTENGEISDGEWRNLRLLRRSANDAAGRDGRAPVAGSCPCTRVRCALARAGHAGPGPGAGSPPCWTGAPWGMGALLYMQDTGSYTMILVNIQK